MLVYNSYAHVGMHPLFALMLPVWRSMHYSFNCSSYLKYRLRVSSVRLVTNSICSTFFFEIIETQPLLVLYFTANTRYAMIDVLSLWYT